MVNRLNKISILLIFLEMFLGSWVSNLGPQQRCPGWPLCYGGFFPPLSDLDAQIEYWHRIVAGLVSVFVLITAVAIWKRRLSPGVRNGARIAVVLLFCIIALGGVGLRIGFPGAITDLQVALTMGLLAVMAVLAALTGGTVQREPSKKGAGRRPQRARFALLMWGLVLVLYLQAILGGLIRYGQTVFSASGIRWLLAVHSGMSILTALLILAVWYVARQAVELGLWSGLLLLLLALEIYMGFRLSAAAGALLHSLHFSAAAGLLAVSAYIGARWNLGVGD